MGNGSLLVADSDTCNDVISSNNRSTSSHMISAMISLLQNAFQDKVFARVEMELLAMEEELMRLIQEKDKEIGKLLDVNQILKLEKIEVEEELKNYRKECGELKFHLLELKQTNFKPGESIASISHTNHLIIELKAKNRELEFAKLKAENEVEIYKRRCEELETRVLLLETDINFIKTEGSSGSRNIRVSEDSLAFGKVENSSEKVLPDTKTELHAVDLGGSHSCRSQHNESGENGKISVAGVAEEMRINKDGRAERGVKVGRRNEESEENNLDGAACNGDAPLNLDEGTAEPSSKQAVDIINSDDGIAEAHSGPVLKRKSGSCDVGGDPNGDSHKKMKYSKYEVSSSSDSSDSEDDTPIRRITRRILAQQQRSSSPFHG